LKLTVNRRGHAAGHGNEDTPSDLDVGCWQIEYKECMRILFTKKCMTAMFVDELGQFPIHELPKDVVGKGLNRLGIGLNVKVWKRPGTCFL